MPRETTTDWPWPGEWESIEDVSKFYKDRLYPALCDFLTGQAEGDTYISYIQGPLTIADLTIGSVLFASTGGVVSQDNDDFFWDATNIRLGINVGTSPSVTLDVGGDCKFDGAVTINDSNDDKDFRVEGSGATYTHLLFTDASTNRFGVNESVPVCLAHFRLATSAVYAGVHTDTVLLLENDDNVMLNLQGGAGGNGIINFCDDAYNPAAGSIHYLHTHDRMEFYSATSLTFLICDGYATTADGMELAVGNFGTPTNPLHVQDEGSIGGWSNSAYGGVVARFRHSGAKHTSVCIDAQATYDPTLVFSEDGAAKWDIRNDATEDNFEIRYQGGETSANATYFTIGTTGDVEIVAGKLSMDTAIATAIDIGNSFTGSQITLTGSSATDHALEIDGVYGAALIYTHTSSATADTMLWGDMASTATTGDFNGLRPRLTCNAASGGLNARAVYGEVIVGASKYAALAQGVLAHASYAAGSCHITDVCPLGSHISQGASLTATNLYGFRSTVQTRGDENISGNDYVMRLENEAVGGNGRQMDGGIQLVNTNMSGGVYGFTYGLDLSGADISTADIILQNGETIKNTTDGIITLTGAATIGDGGSINYSAFAADGILTMAGTGRVTNGFWINAEALKAPTTNPAEKISHGILETPAFQFADAVEGNQENVTYNMRIPDRMDRSAAPTMSLGWSADGISPGNCRWQFEYHWTSPGEDTGAAAQETLYVTGTADDTADGLVISTFTGIDLPSATDVCIHCRITRLSADELDTIEDTVELHGVCLSWTSNKLGTAT